MALLVIRPTTCCRRSPSATKIPDQKPGTAGPARDTPTMMMPGPARHGLGEAGFHPFTGETNTGPAVMTKCGRRRGHGV